MRFGRRANPQHDADVCIDLRERLAPYTGGVELLDEPGPAHELEPVLAAHPMRLRALRAPTYRPRHLAP